MQDQGKGSRGAPQGSVLVVDDDPAIREICADLLEGEGYDVSTAGDGRAAVRALLARPRDVVLMDIMMPELDGISACREVKGNPATAHVRVALMSARTNLSRETQELARADALVAKPFSLDDLLGTVERLLV
jgi:two-component system, OmpR family, response regulator MprA